MSSIYDRQFVRICESWNPPGYFIPESNLLDTMKQSGPLLDAIKILRSRPLAHAAIFIDATQCFRGLNPVIYYDTNMLYSSKKERGIVLIEQLMFLQRIVTRTNVTRGCLFRKKEAVLRIFAKWCKQNSNEIGLALWQCLTNDMTLFDVVYLDIVHGFDVPYFAEVCRQRLVGRFRLQACKMLL